MKSMNDVQNSSKERFPIPSEWKSSRHIIIETYVRLRSPTKVAIELEKNKSYVCRVIRQYKDYLRVLDSTQRTTIEELFV